MVCLHFFPNTISMYEDVVEMVLVVLNNGVSSRDLNKTIIALIAKIKSPKTPMDFRPVNLCYVIFKLVSKVIVNRLKDVLLLIVHESWIM